VKKATRQDLLKLIPSNEVDRPAVVRGLGLIPDWKLGDYLGKLSDDAQRLGIVHELRVLGKLAMRHIRGFAVEPCERGENFDAQLKVREVDMDLEITSLVQPAYKAAVERVCRAIERYLSGRFADQTYEVRLGNMGGGFVNKIADDGAEVLDEDATLRNCIVQLEEAISSDGNVDPRWAKDRFHGPVTSVHLSRRNHAWQKSYRMPGDADVNQVRRKVLGKVDKAQWTGRRPAVLAVVLAHDPDVDLLDQRGEDVVAEAFARVPYLAAVIGLPFYNFLSYPKVIFPLYPGSGASLDEAGREMLTRAFRFWIGVDWRLALHCYRDMRDNMQRDGTWPEWQAIRFGKNAESSQQNLPSGCRSDALAGPQGE
jgi:hypothetical protein